MLEQINKLPLFAQIYIYIGSPIILIILIWVSAKFGLSLKKDSAGFSLSFGKFKNKTKYISKHSACENRTDALEMMRQVRSIERKIMDLKYFENIRKQMDIVEGSVKEAINKLLHIYTSILKQKGEDNPIKTESCQSYIMLLKIMENRLVDKMRIYIRENHFAEKSEMEFDEYVRSRTNELKFMVTESLNQLYYFDKVITRAELYDNNEEKLIEFERIIRDGFHGCRVIAINTFDIIKKLEQNCNEIFSKFI